jgi:hypothetical protein
MCFIFLSFLGQAKKGANKIGTLPCRKNCFLKIIYTAEGFGKRPVSKFAKANSSHKWLSAHLGGTKFSNWNPQSEFTSDE